MIRSTTHFAQMLLENPTFARADLENMFNKIYTAPKVNGVLVSQNMSDEALIKEIIHGMSNNEKYKAAAEHLRNDAEKIASIKGIVIAKDFEPNPPARDDVAEDEDDKEKDTERHAENEVDLKKWPKYEEFRMKWYQKTCDMGWPKDVLPSSKFEVIRKGSIIYPWRKGSHTAYVFNPKGVGSFSVQNYTKRVRDALYNKFENDVRGLKALQSQVDAILEVEKTFFTGRPVRKFMTAILSMAFRGIGGTANDEAVFKWLASKIRGMTIFEYQKFVLDEMVAKMSLDDTTLTELKDILYPVRNRVIKAMKNYEPSPVKGEYVPRLGFICTFKVESKVKNRDTFEAQALMDMIRDVIKPIASGDDVTNKFDESPSVRDLDNLYRKLENLKSGGKSGGKPPSEAITKAIPTLEFVKFKKKDEEKSGAYKILFKYMQYRAIVQVVYSPKDEWNE